MLSVLITWLGTLYQQSIPTLLPLCLDELQIESFLFPEFSYSCCPTSISCLVVPPVLPAWLLAIQSFVKTMQVTVYKTLSHSSLFLHFLIGSFAVLMSNFLSSLCVLEIGPLSDMRLVNIFSHSGGFLFVLLTVSFALQ